MKIEIHDKLRIREIQEQFTAHFPYLKLEFYVGAHASGEGTSNELKISDDAVIGDHRKKHNTGELSIHANLKVNTLETAFSEIFGLNAQVFRKSGNVWLQTTTTDNWTLSEQNETAAELALAP